MTDISLYYQATTASDGKLVGRRNLSKPTRPQSRVSYPDGCRRGGVIFGSAKELGLAR